MANEDDKERVDRKLSELLEELRVAIPGAEVLFAFLLGVAFTERIHTATTLQRNVYFATLLVTAMSTAMLIAPTSYHRLHFRGSKRDKEQMLFTATKLVVRNLDWWRGGRRDGGVVPVVLVHPAAVTTQTQRPRRVRMPQWLKIRRLMSPSTRWWSTGPSRAWCASPLMRRR